MSLSMRRALIILPIWPLCILWLAIWWFSPGRVESFPLFIPLTFAIFYEFAFLPSVFIYFVLRAKSPQRRIAPQGKRVAVISLCVPSKESIEIVEKQLQAMPGITYPHDSWILDEGNSSEIKKLAKKYGVKYFSRRGVRKYNQLLPPFKKKTKAGNVNAWLDHVKWRKYDFFVQLDIDHLPKPNYLNKTLGYFKDQTVAWVQAPSIYKNRSFWTSRGAAEQELILQGPLQMGFYGHSQTPFIIGSHCTYRASAIKQIGGFQPTRAEDHLDTVALASIGYKGVFLPEVIAEGDGPETLNTYLAQQFAWAYSMFQVLLSFSPRLLKTMPLKKKWQFIFAQTWYPFWSLSYLIMFSIPVIALLLKTDVTNSNPLDSFIHFAPIFICSFAIWWAAHPLMQPRHLGLSWRGMILHVVRWPIVLQAVIYAALRVKRSYMITPKGTYAKQVPTLQTYRLFLFFGIISALGVIVSAALFGESAPQGQMVFALTNASLMLIVCVVDLSLKWVELKGTVKSINKYWLKPVAAVGSLAFITALGVASTSLTSPGVSALFYQKQVSHHEKIASAITKTDTKTQFITKLRHLPHQKNELSPLPSLGIYNDPSLKKPAPTNTAPYIDHIFVDWNNTTYLASELLRSYEAGNTPLVTIEPRGNANGQDLLAKINSGEYDQNLHDVMDIVTAAKRPVYVRFAHEAELTNLYPWSGQDPSLYIGAYRHVVTYARAHGASNVQWVWAPAGNIGAEAYYPGDDVVDIVGTTILYDQYWYGGIQPTFQQIAEPRQWLAVFHKPLWIVELGVGKADPAFQRQLVEDALAHYKDMGFDALVYLNIADSNITGPDYHLNDTIALLPLLPKEIAKPQQPRPAPAKKPIAQQKIHASKAWLAGINELIINK